MSQWTACSPAWRILYHVTASCKGPIRIKQQHILSSIGLYRTLVSYSSAYNDFLSGSIIDRTNFRNLFGLLYFDLRNQEDDVKDSVVSLTFRYQLTGNPAGNYTLNALVLHEKEIELYTSSGKLLIKA